MFFGPVHEAVIVEDMFTFGNHSYLMLPIIKLLGAYFTRETYIIFADDHSPPLQDLLGLFVGVPSKKLALAHYLYWFNILIYWFWGCTWMAPWWWLGLTLMFTTILLYLHIILYYSWYVVVCFWNFHGDLILYFLCYITWAFDTP